MNIQKRIYNIISEMRKKNCKIEDLMFKLDKLRDELVRYTRKGYKNCQFESGDVHNLITSVKTKIKKYNTNKEQNKILNSITYEKLLDKLKEYDIITDKEIFQISDYHRDLSRKILNLIDTNTIHFKLFDIYFQLSYVCFIVRIFEEMERV